MRNFIPQALMNQLTQAVRLAIRDNGVVNIPRLAEEVRRRNERANVALEDIEEQMLICARSLRAAMEFDSVVRGPNEATVSHQSRGVVRLDVAPGANKAS